MKVSYLIWIFLILRTSAQGVLDEAKKNELFAKLLTYGDACDQTVEDAFYASIENVNADGIEAATDGIPTDSKICNRFKGLSCHIHIPGSTTCQAPDPPGNLEQKCGCPSKMYWGGADHPYCSLRLNKNCGLQNRKRQTHSVKTKFTNLNEELSCTKNAHCGILGRCICQPHLLNECEKGGSGTELEKTEECLTKVFAGLTAKNWTHKFMTFGTRCDPDPQNHFYRDDISYYGLDLPKLIPYLLGPNISESEKTKCNVMMNHECRKLYEDPAARGVICQCRTGFEPVTKGSIICQPAENTNCQLIGYHDSNYWVIGQLECWRGQVCKFGLEGHNKICCPKKSIPETNARCGKFVPNSGEKLGIVKMGEKEDVLVYAVLIAIVIWPYFVPGH